MLSRGICYGLRRKKPRVSGIYCCIYPSKAPYINYVYINFRLYTQHICVLYAQNPLLHRPKKSIFRLRGLYFIYIIYICNLYIWCYWGPIEHHIYNMYSIFQVSQNLDLREIYLDLKVIYYILHWDQGNLRAMYNMLSSRAISAGQYTTL